MSDFSCFVSHSASDKIIADKITKSMKRLFREKIEVFCSSISLLPSDSWMDRIKENIIKSDVVISVLTLNSIRSPWVLAEAGVAWAMKDKLHFSLACGGLRIDEIPQFITHKQISYPTHEPGYLKKIFEKICNEKGLEIAIDDELFDSEAESILKSFQSVRTPEDVVRDWNNSLKNRDLAQAKSLTSIKSFSYIDSKWGSLESLSEIYVENGNHSDHEDIIVDVDYAKSGKEAIVTYICFYNSKENYAVKEWRDLVVLENGIWRVAPEYAVVKILRG